MQLQLQRANSRQLHWPPRPSLRRPVASDDSEYFHLLFWGLVDPTLAPASLRWADHFDPMLSKAHPRSSVVSLFAQHRSEHFRRCNRHLGLEHFDVGSNFLAARRFRPLPHLPCFQPNFEFDSRWRLRRKRGDLSTEGIQRRTGTGSHRFHPKRCWKQNYVLTFIYLQNNKYIYLFFHNNLELELFIQQVNSIIENKQFSNMFFHIFQRILTCKQMIVI